MIIQCRVRPGAYQIHCENIWSVSSHEDIRPYGIILGINKRTDNNDWIKTILYIII